MWQWFASLWHKNEKVLALDWLSAKRLDVMAKYLYCKYQDHGSQSQWHKWLYQHHLAVLNNFYEEGKYTGEYTEGAHAFLNKFDRLIRSIKKYGYRPDKEPLWVDRQGNLLNGSHRLATCLYFGIKPRFAIKPERWGQKIIDYDYLIHKRNFVATGLEQKAAERMVLEYIRLKKGAFTVTIFPAAQGKSAQIESCLKRYGDILYKAEFPLTKNGQRNWIETLYRGERWLGHHETGYTGISAKTLACYPHSGTTRVYWLTGLRPNQTTKLKTEIRSYFALGKHACHINDTERETQRISETCLTPHGRHWLNHRRLPMPTHFLALLREFTPFLHKQGLNAEDVAVGGSAVLAAYGLRDCRDFDLISRKKFQRHRDYNSHATELKYYGTNLDELVDNPDHHFYYEGIKFITLANVAALKKHRGEMKDQADLHLLATV